MQGIGHESVALSNQKIRKYSQTSLAHCRFFMELRYTCFLKCGVESDIHKNFGVEISMGCSLDGG